jgi:hypothetical protein
VSSHQYGSVTEQARFPFRLVCQWFDEYGELRQDIFDLDNVRCQPRSIPAGSV